MTVAAICRCKDEADVIAGSVLHMADEVDFLLVADNNSTDGTREVLAELADTIELTVIDDPETGYYQSRQMSSLAEKAAGMGATWIVPFDADELWVAPHRISRLLNGLAANVGVVTADVLDHRPTAVDPEGVDPFATIIWRETKPLPLPKVAFRWQPGAVIHQGNHGVDLPLEHRRQAGLQVRHFPYRSAEQFVRKARNGAAAYRATDLPAHIGAHWRQYGDLLDRYGPSALADVFRQYFWRLAPTEAGMVPDPAPYRRWSRS